MLIEKARDSGDEQEMAGCLYDLGKYVQGLEGFGTFPLATICWARHANFSIICSQTMKELGNQSSARHPYTLKRVILQMRKRLTMSCFLHDAKSLAAASSRYP